jgi:hypothetical protein
MKDKNELARGWVLKAESDLTSVRQMLASEGPFEPLVFTVSRP